MKRLKKAVVLMLALVTVCATEPVVANAVSATLDYTSTDTDGTYGTSSKLTAKTDLLVDVPINPFANDTVRSKGCSNVTFDKNGKSVTRSFVSHTIYAKIGGIGGGTISSSSGVEISTSGSSATYSANTYNWNYTIYSDILALYSYRETHTVNFVLKKSSGAKTTVTMSAQVKY